MSERPEQEAFWDGIEPREGRCITVAVLERTLSDEIPRWFEAYLTLKNVLGVKHRYAALAAWKSLAKDDRGEVETREEFARLVGVSRSTTYQWEARQPVDDWAQWLQDRRLLGSRLAEVDERTYRAAVAEESSAADRKLFYERAGALEEVQRLHLVGDDDGPVEYVDVSEDEFEAIRRGLIAEAEKRGAEG